MNDEEWETIRIADRPLDKGDEERAGRYGVIPAGKLVMQLKNIGEREYYIRMVRDNGFLVLVEWEKGKKDVEHNLLYAFDSRWGFPARDIKEKIMEYVGRYCLKLQGMSLNNAIGEVPVLNQSSSICNDEFNKVLEELLGFKVDSTDIGISPPFSMCGDSYEFRRNVDRYYGRIARLRKMNGLLYNEESLQKEFEADRLLQESVLEKKARG